MIGGHQALEEVASCSNVKLGFVFWVRTLASLHGQLDAHAFDENTTVFLPELSEGTLVVG